MRKITQQAAAAFWSGQDFSQGNTMVTRAEGRIMLWLHGNLIAKRNGPNLQITMAGWGSPVTRERINGVLRVQAHDPGRITSRGLVQRAGRQCWQVVARDGTAKSQTIDPSAWYTVQGANMVRHT